MSDQETEQTQDGEVEAVPEELPAEQSSGMEAADEMEAEAEAEDQEIAQVEGHPEQPEGLSQKQLEQALGKLEREAERHSKRVTEIMGSEIELLLTCPLCDPVTPGPIMPTPATPQRFSAVREF